MSWTYDQVGNKKSQQRANNQIITYDVYDAMNRLQVQSVQHEATVTDRTVMTYDLAGNLETFTDGRQKVYTYDHDLLNRRISVTYPKDEGGTVRSEAYHYDLANNMDTYTNRAGAVQTFIYDNRNRNTYFSWSDGVTNSRYTSYDPAGNILNVHVHPDGGDSIDYLYDFRNRKTNETQKSGGLLFPWTMRFTYDADSNRKTITYPSGSVFTYNYNSRNQLKNETDATSAIVSYSYDLSGNRRTRTLRNGTSTTYTPDSLNRPLWVNHDHGGTGFGLFEYGYDSVNRVDWVMRDSARGDAFEYYLDDQLKSGQFDAWNPNFTPTGAANTTSLAYDGNGNRTSQTNQSTPSYTYGANDLNQYNLVNAMAPTYDANGNLSTYDDSGFSSWYSYDAQNRLSQANKSGNNVRFWYDALGRQLLRNVNGQWIYSVWDGWNLIEEHSTSALLHLYLHGAGTDEMVQRWDGGGVPNTIWYYQDAQGSTTHLANDAGNVIETYKYDPALGGTPSIYNASGQLITSSASENRFLYTGRDWLKEVALYDYRNRFYHPRLGRFLQPDPIGFAADPGNVYRYCGNNAINGSDPSGLLEELKKPLEAQTSPVTVTSSPLYGGGGGWTSPIGGSGYGSFSTFGGRDHSGGGSARSLPRLGRDSSWKGTVPNAPKSTQGSWTDLSGLPTGPDGYILPDEVLIAWLKWVVEKVNQAEGRIDLFDVRWKEFMWRFDTKFYDYGNSMFSYEGMFTELHGTWTGFQVNYIGVGGGFAGHGESRSSMADRIGWWNYEQYNLHFTGAEVQGKMMWAELGYDYYLHHR